jgi:hypothetical protein
VPLIDCDCAHKTTFMDGTRSPAVRTKRERDVRTVRRIDMIPPESADQWNGREVFLGPLRIKLSKTYLESHELSKISFARGEILVVVHACKV